MSNLSINLLMNKTYPNPICATKIVNKFNTNLTTAQGKYLGAKTGVMTSELAPVVGITLWTPSRKFSACATPGVESVVSIPRRISQSVEKLRGDVKHSYEEVFAFITGGCAYKTGNKSANESIEIIDEILKALDKKGVETSVIAEPLNEKNNSLLNSYCISNNITIWGKSINDTKISIGDSKDNIENALEDNFDFVSISKYMPINVINKLPPSAETKIMSK